MITIGRFTLFFIVINVLEQFIKIPLERAFINNYYTAAIPYKLAFLFVATPNIIFYVFVGIALSLVIKKNIIFWFTLYCVLELAWLFLTTSAEFNKPDIYQYLLIYFRYIVIPFAVCFGVWGQRKLGKNWQKN
jgi:hypothetical protein